MWMHCIVALALGAAPVDDPARAEREAARQEREKARLERLAEREAKGETKVPQIAADMPVDSDPIQILATGLVRTRDGQPLANAAVELQMNPYYPTATSSKTWTATDSYGRYALTGVGHHGTARVRVAAEGYRMDIRELGFIRRSREISFNFSLVADPGQNVSR